MRFEVPKSFWWGVFAGIVLAYLMALARFQFRDPLPPCDEGQLVESMQRELVWARGYYELEKECKRGSK